eukprot:3882680-Pleurochrysis_carterae.AAC.2
MSVRLFMLFANGTYSLTQTSDRSSPHAHMRRLGVHFSAGVRAPCVLWPVCNAYVLFARVRAHTLVSAHACCWSECASVLCLHKAECDELTTSEALRFEAKALHGDVPQARARFDSLRFVLIRFFSTRYDSMCDATFDAFCAEPDATARLRSHA